MANERKICMIIGSAPVTGGKLPGDVSPEDCYVICADGGMDTAARMGITPDLSLPSHLILIGLMYFGRVGGLTILYAMSSGTNPASSQMPQEKISVG